jgi:hypothetical protein
MAPRKKISGEQLARAKKYLAIMREIKALTEKINEKLSGLKH